MRVAIGVHGRYHAFDLARELANSAVDVWLATTYPKTVACKHLTAAVSVRAAPSLELVRRSASLLSCSADVFVATRFARFVRKSLPLGADVFVGWSGASLEALDVARDRGMAVVIERGSSHILHQKEVLASEYARSGIRHPGVDQRVVDRELEEYEKADAIAVPTGFAAETFARRGIDPGKLIVNPYGADLPRFASRPPRRESAGPIRVLFLGQVGFRKGVPSLLQAIQELAGTHHLDLVGPIEPVMKPFLRSRNWKHTTFHGPLGGSRLDSAFSRAQIFCLPSLEEGLPLALLQAMAAGLPVVASPETGATDILTEGREGLLAPAGDVRKIAAALLALENPERRAAMGQSARQRVAAGLTWRDYGTRAIAAYERLLLRNSSASGISHPARSRDGR